MNKTLHTVILGLIIILFGAIITKHFIFNLEPTNSEMIILICLQLLEISIKIDLKNKE